ncbi:MAG: DUF488 domain-containing protein [Deltaproteobacteria bacterium]|nr:DUF488 domain-containing protein [Deltaproteobacteria bacterium]
MALFTIGHSNDSLEHFLELIQKNGIDTVVDVRRIPYSRYAKQFNKKALAEFLKHHGIHYIFMGDSLGGKITDPQYLTKDGHIDYAKVMKSGRFLEGISRLEGGIRKGFTIALLCAEKDPLKCHRFHLISRFLAPKGYEILHIVGDKILKHEELERKIDGLFSHSGIKNSP